MSPTRSTEVGSPTMQQSRRSPLALSHSTSLTVPSTAGPSSSLVIISAMDPACRGCAATNSSMATTMAAMEVFMSAAPRPYSLPSRCVGAKGSLCHWASGPVGTTSVWPANASSGAAASAPRRTAQRLVTRKSSGPLCIVSQTKPSGLSRSMIRGWKPPSFGVRDRQAISCSVNCKVRDIGVSVLQSCAACARVVGANVQRDFGEGRLVVGVFLLRLDTRHGAHVVLQTPHQVGGRIGEGEAFVARDDTLCDEARQILFKCLRTFGQRLLHGLFHGVEVAL